MSNYFARLLYVTANRDLHYADIGRYRDSRASDVGEIDISKYCSHGKLRLFFEYIG